MIMIISFTLKHKEQMLYEASSCCARSAGRPHFSRHWCRAQEAAIFPSKRHARFRAEVHLPNLAAAATAAAAASRPVAPAAPGTDRAGSSCELADDRVERSCL